MIDSHCHLAGPEFADDLVEVVARATTGGLQGAFVILAADDAGELVRAGAVAAAWPSVRFSIGVHPHAAGSYADDGARCAADVAAAIARQPSARAVGEIGLDYHYDFSPREAQQQVFRAQLGLARAVGLPIVLHTREAEDDTFRILEDEQASSVGGVFHCFTGDRAMARRALDAGFHISLSGIVSFPRATELHEVARMVPLDRLLIETDSPYLAPVPFRGRRNEPVHALRVAEVVAELRGEPTETVCAAASDNFTRLFVP